MFVRSYSWNVNKIKLMKRIQSIPINREGDLLFLKEFREDNGRFFIKMKSMLNQIPFKEEELFLTDENQNFVVLGGNGKPVFRFPIQYALNTMKDEK